MLVNNKKNHLITTLVKPWSISFRQFIFLINFIVSFHGFQLYIYIFIYEIKLKHTHMKPRKLDNKFLHVVIFAFLDVAGMAEEPLEAFPER